MEPKKKNHKVLKIVGIVFVVLIVLGAISSATQTKKTADKNYTGTANSTASNNNAPASQQSASKVAKIGEPVRDGKFEFVVKSIQCGVTEVSFESYSSKQPQGQYCLLSLSVRNIGSEQQYFSPSNQKLIDSDKLQYSYDAVATLYKNNNQDAWGAQINPGNGVQGIIVFDIPKDKSVTSAELHDSSLSSGVKVSLQ